MMCCAIEIMSMLLLNYVDRTSCRGNETSHKIYVANNSRDFSYRRNDDSTFLVIINSATRLK